MDIDCENRCGDRKKKGFDMTITAKDLEDAIETLYKQEENRDGYTYFLPSPNKGKRFLIHGWIYPYEAALMVYNVWKGTKTVADYPCMTEIDI